MSKSNLHDLLERIGNLVRADIRNSVASLGLQPVQVEVLNYLSLCNRYSDTPLAVTEYLGQTKGTVSQTIKVLEGKGLLSKQKDKKDGRVIHLSLTAAGRKLLREHTPSVLLKNTIAAASIEELEANEVALTALLRKIQTANNLHGFGACRSCRHNQRLDNGKFRCGLTGEPLSRTEVQLICREHEAA
ncbi:MAG: MarR family winged helix-turn-helix transcriptional regulator [bacterium]